MTSPHPPRVVVAVLALLLGATALGTAALEDAPPPAVSADGDPPVNIAGLQTVAAAVRELPFLSPVEMMRVSPEEAVPLLAAQLDEDLPEVGAADEVRLLAEFGLLPFEYPLRTRLLALLEEQVAGFYDPRSKRFVVVDGIGERFEGLAALMLPAIYGHELLHALADQHFDLSQLILRPAAQGRDDVVMARRALAEGDATLGMLIMVFKQQGLTLTPEALPTGEALRSLVRTSVAFPELEQAPPYLKAQLIEPYLLGLERVGDAWKAGGWDAVNRLWLDPPLSTEQLLHPERIDDLPSDLVGPAIPAGSEAIVSMELGELGMRQWLEQELGPDRAAIAAAGWDGDRVVLWRDAAGSERIEIVSAWDSETDAEEFLVAADTWLRRTKKDELDGKSTWSIRQAGDRVALWLLPGASLNPEVYSDEPPIPVIDIGPEPSFPEFK